MGAPKEEPMTKPVTAILSIALGLAAGAGQAQEVTLRVVK